jgi:hypothetical protein
MMKILVALAGSLLALVCLTTPAGAKPSAPPAAQQDSARATGNAPNTTGSGGYFNIDISAQSGPTGENPTGHGSYNLGSPSGLLVAGPVTCLQVSGHIAYIGFNDTTFGFGAIGVKLVDGGVAGSSLDTFDSFLGNGSTTNCGFRPLLGDLPVVGGDVQVIDAPSVPGSTADCKNGGWQNFGAVFKNQGQCVAYVERGPKR